MQADRDRLRRRSRAHLDAGTRTLSSGRAAVGGLRRDILRLLLVEVLSQTRGKLLAETCLGSLAPERVGSLHNIADQVMRGPAWCCSAAASLPAAACFLDASTRVQPAPRGPLPSAGRQNRPRHETRGASKRATSCPRPCRVLGDCSAPSKRRYPRTGDSAARRIPRNLHRRVSGCSLVGGHL